MSKKSFFLNSIIALLVINAIFLSSCKPKNNKAQFYYWKQDVSLNLAESDLLEKLNSSKLYVKFFDVENRLPVAKVKFNDVPSHLEIIPCIYITNESIKNEYDIKNLAFNVNRLLQEILTNNQIKIKEVQIDCDWTLSTKAKYFDFLNEFKAYQNEGIQVTATLRLHQLKYPEKTGVPPVDKVLLMCYNVGNIQSIDEDNSIFELAEFKNYVNKKTTYPLAMDFALPAFSWAVIYRFDHLALIVNNVSLEDLENNANLEKQKYNTFKVKNDHYFNNSYLYKDDVLRHEAATAAVLKSIIPLFENLKNTNSELIFFDLSNKNALNYSYEDYQNIISKF